MREEFYAGLEDRKYVTLGAAQKKAFKVDWTLPENIPVTPKLLGTKVYMDFPIEDVLAYIDWNPFFQVGPVAGLRLMRLGVCASSGSLESCLVSRLGSIAAGVRM